MSEKAKNGKSRTGGSKQVAESVTSLLRKLLDRQGIKSFIDRKWPLALVASCLIGLFASPNLNLFSREYQAGEYVERAIKARRTILVEDRESTKARRQQAADEMPPVFDYDPSLVKRQNALVDSAFDRMRLYLGIAGTKDAGDRMGQVNFISKSDLVQAQTVFMQTLNLSNFSKTDFAFLSQGDNADAALALVHRFIDMTAQKIVITGRDSFLHQFDAMSPEDRSFVLRDVVSGKETVVKDFSNVVDSASLLDMFSADDPATRNQGKKIVDFASRIALVVIGPNTSINLPETDKRREEAKEAVLPSQIKYDKNQIIIPEGDKITGDKLLILEQIDHQTGRTNQLLTFIAVSGLSFLLMAVVFRFADKNVRKFFLSTRDMLFLMTIIISTTLLIRLSIYLASVLSEAFEFLPESALIYAVPFASAAILVRILLNSEISITVILIIAYVAGILTGGENQLMLFVLAGSFAGTSFVRWASRRKKIVMAGIVVGLVNMGALLGLAGVGGFSEDILALSTLFNLLGGLVGGLMCGLTVLATLPLLEGIFGYTSDVSLLEMVSLNNPLLKDMVVRAPGTYTHCNRVSTLAEAGAQSIHANPLLAKVGGVFHDVGKLNKPQYFGENLSDIEDNEDLHPSMLSIILISHVREGVDLAKRFRLGDRITNIIREHHGTSVIRDFFRLASSGEIPGLAAHSEDEYRYPGPKPQSREAALVMLADVVEAGSHSLTHPTLEEIENRVKGLISEVFLDNQLSECNLTLDDLRQVTETYVKVTAGFHHGRIEYPELPPKTAAEASIVAEREAENAESSDT